MKKDQYMLEMLSSKSLSKIAIVICILSLIFQLLGISCPGWIIITVDLSVVGVGSDVNMLGFEEMVSESAVWYVRVCVQGDSVATCSSTSRHGSQKAGLKLDTTVSDLVTVNWVEVEVELTVALVFSFFGTGLVVTSFFDLKVARKVLAAISSACMLTSGILITPAVIHVGQSTQNTKASLAVLAEGKTPIAVRTPWALALSATGLTFALFGCVVLILSACKQNEQTSTTVAPSDCALPPAILIMGDLPVTISNITIADRVVTTGPPSCRSVCDVATLSLDIERPTEENSFIDLLSVFPANSGQAYSLEDTQATY